MSDMEIKYGTRRFKNAMPPEKVKEITTGRKYAKTMKRSDFAKTIDHAMLWQDSPAAMVEKRCHEVVEYGFGSICCFPCEVERARKIIGDRPGVCAVVGYPMGAHTTETKVFEAEDCIAKGADEVDLVMNIARFKDGDYDYVLNEFKAVVQACKAKLPSCIVKIIIESYHLESREEFKKACELVIESGADYVKQATGYAPNPDEHVGTEYLKQIREILDELGSDIKIKNAGIPKDLDEAVYYVKELGVSRIGHNFMPEWFAAAGDDYWLPED